MVLVIETEQTVVQLEFGSDVVARLLVLGQISQCNGVFLARALVVQFCRHGGQNGIVVFQIFSSDGILLEN